MPADLATAPRLSRPAIDRVGRHPARQLGRELATLTGRKRAVVLLADLTDGTELDRYSGGPRPGPIDGDALLALVLPTEPTVCDTARLHEPSLRLLARRWRTDRLLVAPCTFGHLLVALAIVAIAPDADAHVVVRAARPLCERFAVAVVGTRLFANSRDFTLKDDSSPFTADA